MPVSDEGQAWITQRRAAFPLSQAGEVPGAAERDGSPSRSTDLLASDPQKSSDTEQQMLGKHIPGSGKLFLMRTLETCVRKPVGSSPGMTASFVLEARSLLRGCRRRRPSGASPEAKRAANHGGQGPTPFLRQG